MPARRGPGAAVGSRDLEDRIRENRDVSCFVGRRRERSELGEALDSAVAGHGGLILISGEPGIGKTRLCQELADEAGARGVTVAWARCWEAATVPAFRVWDQLLAALGDTQVPTAPPGRALDDADAARMRVFDGVVAAVLRAAALRPLLLVLDDLHWADVGSVMLLGYLASEARDAGVLIVTTFRDVEARPGTGVGDAIAELGRHGRHLPLAGLGVEDVPALVESATGVAGRRVDAAAVHHHTGGNPLFAQELVRLLETHGTLSALTAGDLAPVPATVKGVLSRRLHDLSEDCRTVLATASVVGDEFDLDLVETLTALGRDRLLEVVDEASAANVLRDAGVAVFAFTHPLVRSTLYDDLGVARRVRLHERVGVALEARLAAGRAVDLAALAHHFVKATAAGTAAKAARYALDAADEALARLAYESAVTLYERALGALDLDPSAGDRADVLLRLGAAQTAAGSRQAARVTYLSAAELARRAGRSEQFARAALGAGGGSGFEVVLGDREQIDLLEEARRSLGDGSPALRALVAARLSVALSLSGADDRRLALSEEAVALARAGDDRNALAYALSAHCDAIAGPADVHQRLRECTEMVEAAVASGDPTLELLGRRMRVVSLLELGDTPAVDAEIEAYARLAGVVRQPLYGWYAPLWRGMRALMRGDLAGCARWREAAAALAAQAQSVNAPLLLEGLRWYEMRAIGETEGPLAAIDIIAEQAPLLGAQVVVTMAVILAEAGRRDEARARLDAGAAAIRSMPVDSEWLPAMGQLAEAVARIGGHPIAAWAYEKLLSHRGLFGVEGIGGACWGSVERPLGLLAASLGRMEEAAAHFDAAVAANRAAGSPLFVAVTLRDAGLALDDPRRLAAAVTAYRELGIDSRVAELEGRLSRSVAAPAPANVFRRDGDVWLLAYAGTEARVKDVKGLRDLAYLLARPGREVASVELAGSPGAPLQGDLGEVVDAQAREAYKARVLELDIELEEADAAGDAARSARAQAEREALLAELSAALGLGGRPRRAGDGGERARQAVTWRVRDAIGRVEAASPELGRHLRRSVRTGTFCSYDPADPVDWSL